MLSALEQTVYDFALPIFFFFFLFWGKIIKGRMTAFVKEGPPTVLTFINEPLLKTLQCHLLDTSIFYMVFNVHCTKISINK